MGKTKKEAMCSTDWKMECVGQTEKKSQRKESFGKEGWRGWSEGVLWIEVPRIPPGAKNLGGLQEHRMARARGTRLEKWWWEGLKAPGLFWILLQQGYLLSLLYLSTGHFYFWKCPENVIQTISKLRKISWVVFSLHCSSSCLFLPRPLW